MGLTPDQAARQITTTPHGQFALYDTRRGEVVKSDRWGGRDERWAELRWEDGMCLHLNDRSTSPSCPSPSPISTFVPPPLHVPLILPSFPPSSLHSPDRSRTGDGWETWG